jgi:hypothetical protein
MAGSLALEVYGPPPNQWSEDQSGIQVGAVGGLSGAGSATSLDIGVTQHLLSTLNGLPTPTATRPANWGTGGGGPNMGAHSTDLAQWITATGPAGSTATAIAIVTFGTPYPSYAIMTAILAPHTGMSWGLGAYITNLTNTGYTIAITGTLSSFQSYQFHVLIVATSPSVIPAAVGQTATLTGSAVGAISTGFAASTATLSGAAVGQSSYSASGTAASTSTLSGAAAGAIAATGAVSASLSGTAAGTLATVAAGSSTASLTGIAAGVPSPIGATADTTSALAGLATGVVGTPASAATSATLSGVAFGSAGFPAPPTNGLCIFLTPQVRDRPPYLPSSSAMATNLMRHFENRLRGVLVWLRNDGTYCVDTPCAYEAAMTQPAAWISDDPIGPDETADFQGLTDSNVNYPWNPYPGSTNSTIPGSFVSNTNWDQTTQEYVLNPYMVQWWEGGAENVITQAQALALTAAGFGDCIADAPPNAVLGSEPDGQGPYGSWAINA